MKSALSGIVEPKTLSVLRTFLTGRLYHLKEASRSSRVPVSTSSRIIRNFLKEGLIEEIKVGKMRLYKIRETEQVKALRRLI